MARGGVAAADGIAQHLADPRRIAGKTEFGRRAVEARKVAIEAQEAGARLPAHGLDQLEIGGVPVAKRAFSRHS